MDNFGKILRTFALAGVTALGGTPGISEGARQDVLGVAASTSVRNNTGERVVFALSGLAAAAGLGGGLLWYRRRRATENPNTAVRHIKTPEDPRSHQQIFKDLPHKLREGLFREVQRDCRIIYEVYKNDPGFYGVLLDSYIGLVMGLTPEGLEKIVSDISAQSFEEGVNGYLGKKIAQLRKTVAPPSGGVDIEDLVRKIRASQPQSVVPRDFPVVNQVLSLQDFSVLPPRDGAETSNTPGGLASTESDIDLLLDLENPKIETQDSKQAMRPADLQEILTPITKEQLRSMFDILGKPKDGITVRIPDIMGEERSATDIKENDDGYAEITYRNISGPQQGSYTVDMSGGGYVSYIQEEDLIRRINQFIIQHNEGVYSYNYEKLLRNIEPDVTELGDSVKMEVGSRFLGKGLSEFLNKTGFVIENIGDGDSIRIIPTNPRVSIEMNGGNSISVGRKNLLLPGGTIAYFLKRDGKNFVAVEGKKDNKDITLYLEIVIH